MADATRQRLLRSAIELFSTRGYHATTTPAIARRAGVAEGTIYRHFAGKQDLLNELVRGALRWAQGQIPAPADERTPRAQLDRLAAALADCAVHDPAVIRVGFLTPHGVLLDDRSRDAERAFREAVERIVARGKSEGSVRAGGAELWTGVWLAVVLHVLDRVSRGEWARDAPVVAQALEGAWSAIASRAPDQDRPRGDA